MQREQRIRRRVFVANGAAFCGLAALGTARGGEAGGKRRRVKVGQIGVGHAHAGGKMAALRKLADDFEVVGVVEPDAALRRQWEGHPIYRGLRWMTEAELLGVKGLEAVAVETEVRQLVPTAARCVAAGMHLHLDKPAGESLPEFRKLLAEADRRRLCVQMGYMYRNNPAVLYAFRAAREGWLGRIFEVHGVMSKMNTPAQRRPMLPYRGGVMFELGCHLIDAVVAILGPPSGVTPFARRTWPQVDDLYDHQLAVLEYPQAVATVRVTVCEVDGMRRRQLVVAGDEGTIDIRPIEPPRLSITLARPRGGLPKGTHEVTLPPMPGRYDEQLAELAQVIRGEKVHPFPSQHDLAVQETVLRASGLA